MNRGQAMLQAFHSLAHAEVGVPPAPVSSPTSRTPARDPLDRLARLHREGDALRAELRRTLARLAEARAYLASDGSNTILGRAQVQRLRDRKSHLLARLGSHRIRVHEALLFPHVQLDLQS